MSVFGVILVRHFPAFELNTKRYSVSLRIQSECGKIRTRKTPNTDTLHVVVIRWNQGFFLKVKIFLKRRYGISEKVENFIRQSNSETFKICMGKVFSFFQNLSTWYTFWRYWHCKRCYLLKLIQNEPFWDCSRMT